MYLSATILVTLIFGAAAVYFSIREEKTKKELIERERNQKHRIYEISILKEIQERIGYELDLEKVIDVIIGSLKNLFPYSSASALFVEDGKLTFKSFLEEEVSRSFIEQVKSGMLASFNQLSESPLPQTVNENLYGAPINNANTKHLSSFFHIPIIINNKVTGVISVSSTQAGLYKEDEMTILYKITSQASDALSKLQAVLTTEKGKLLSLIGGLADGVFMVDTQNRLLVINKASKKLLKIEKENPTILDIQASKSGVYDFSGKIAQAISTNTEIEEKEIDFGDKIVRIFIKPVSSDHEVLGASILIQDITLEKNLLKMKEEFTNIIVHELRAPLTAIKSASELMKKPLKLSEDEKNRLMLIIDEQSKKLLDDVSLLLDAAKLQAGQFSVNRQLYDIKSVISDSLAVFKPSAQARSIELVAELGEDLPKVEIDPLRIGQVINNLVSNGLKFTKGGGKITVKGFLNKREEAFALADELNAGLAKNSNNNLSNGDRRSLSEDETVLKTDQEIAERHLQRAGSELLISVSDTGIGIPKEKQGALFSKFTQIAYPTDVYSRKYPGSLSHLTSGTGLGLYIVKAIVEAHGGSVLLDSEPGKGTIISFTLPVNNKQQTDQPINHAETSEKPSEHSERPGTSQGLSP